MEPMGTWTYDHRFQFPRINFNTVPQIRAESRHMYADSTATPEVTLSCTLTQQTLLTYTRP